MNAPFPSIVASVIILAATACAGEPTDPARTDAESAAAVADGSAEAAQVGGWYADTAVLAAGVAPPVGEARALVTAATVETIGAAVSPPACATVTTDSATYVQATFTGCTGPGGRAALSGTVRGELGFDTTPCGPAQCPTAVRWTITADLAYGDGGALDGAMTVVAPVAADAPRTLDATLQLTSRRGDAVAATADATWTVDDAGCATLSGSAAVTGPASGAVTIDGLVACPAVCPTAGTVAMTAGGRTLSFTYDGGDSVVVASGGGQSFELPLPCGR